MVKLEQKCSQSNKGNKDRTSNKKYQMNLQKGADRQKFHLVVLPLRVFAAVLLARTGT